MTPAGRADPLFADFPERLDVGHWHGDMPGLTPQARVLATSEGCPRQIVAYAPRVVGFQCHMELTREVVELLIEASTAELAASAQRRFVQQADVLRSHDYGAMNRWMFAFLDRFAARADAV